MNSLQRIAAGLLLLASFLGTTDVRAQTVGTQLRLIEEVEFVVDDAAYPPDDSAPWQAMQLPYGVRIADEDASDRTIWFRFQLDTPNNSGLHSLYFYRYNLSLQAYFNDELIGGDSFRPNRQTVSWNHPRLIDIQNSNWQAQSNTVHVRLRTSYFGGTFAPILFGENTALQPLFEKRLFWQVRINEWLQAMGIIVTLFALVLWGARPKDATYPYFACMTASWTILTTHMVVYYNVLDYRYWLPLVHLGVNIWALMLFYFLSSISSIDSPRAKSGMKIWFALSISWHLIAPIEFWWLGAYATHAIANGFLVYMMARIVNKAVRQKDLISIAISAAIALQVIFFAHDLAMVLFTEGAAWEGAIYWSQLGFPILLGVFTANLLGRFTSALSLAENLNRDLEAKVERSRIIIEKSFAQKRELELAQAAEQERLAIYRDLHDDVGSKLLSIVHAGRDSKLGDLARAALESLRNAVSRANSPDLPISQFLEKLEEETLLRLEGSGHRVSWERVGSLPDAILPSDAVFNLNQIFREAVSNIIRHAHANEVRFRCECAHDELVFIIEDNGCGLLSPGSEGNGLNNIKLRTRELDASVRWTNRSEGGLRFQLDLSLAANSSIT